MGVFMSGEIEEFKTLIKQYQDAMDSLMKLSALRQEIIGKLEQAVKIQSETIVVMQKSIIDLKGIIRLKDEKIEMHKQSGGMLK